MDILLYLSTLLEDEGYETDTAPDARQADQQIRQSKPDLITLDIMMPRESGIAFYRTLKLDHETKDIPVIFISAFSLAQSFTGFKFRKLIPDENVPEPEGFIEKPVEIPNLLDMIHSAIG